MKRKPTALILFVLSFFLFQCQREISFQTDTIDIAPGTASQPLAAALQGNVFDETGTPAKGVSVQVGTQTTITDASGYFRINNAALDKKASLVTAIKAGYFKAYRTFAATSGANYVNIKLIKKVLAGSVNSSNGGDVSLANGSKVVLPAGGIVNAATFTAYNGTVHVYAAYIDPTAADIGQTVPGSFIANDESGSRVTLTSYGMLAVELESTSGERLQIKSGATAVLTTSIPPARQASAPATISLWSVNEKTGVWEEEGTATKNGTFYVGTVKHFSFWNCDVSANAVYLSMTLKTPSGAPLVRAWVQLRRTGNGWTSNGYTDSLGQVSGYVPRNEALAIDILDDCNNSVYHQAIGPFTQNTNLGSIQVTIPEPSLVTIKGKLMSCANTPVTNGYAIINYGYNSNYVAVLPTGDFQLSFVHCPSEPSNFDLIAVDSAGQQSNTTNFALSSGTTDVGNVSACGSSSAQFINYTLDGVTFQINGAADTIQGGSQPIGGSSVAMETVTYIDGAKAGTGNFISIEFVTNNERPGSYPMTGIGVNTPDSAAAPTSMNITVTNFPTAGGFYEGDFGGQFKDGSNALHTLSGTFRVRRQ